MQKCINCECKYINSENRDFTSDKFCSEKCSIDYIVIKDKEDLVNHPKHYQMLPDMEAIEGIKKLLTKEEFIGYLKGNFFKYRFRAGDKDLVEQEIKKSNWYREYLKGYIA